MMYKVLKGALSHYNGQVDWSEAESKHKEDTSLGSLEVVHKPSMQQTGFKIQLMSQRFIVFAENAAELADAVRYVRSLGFLQELTL